MYIFIISFSFYLLSSTILSPQCRYHQIEVSFTDSLTHIGLLSQSFTASFRLNRCGHILTAGVKNGLTAYTHYRSMAPKVVCLTVAMVARITHLNQEE